MMIHLINMCNKFVALNAMMDKLSDPYARIDPDDLHCFDFKEFGTVPADEGLFWALHNIADQIHDLFKRFEGTAWYEYDGRRKIDKKIRDLQKVIKRVEEGKYERKAPWEPGEI